MKVKINNKCIPIDQLISIKEYADKTGQTRANVYYHLKEKNLKTIKIAGTSFIIEENNDSDNEQVTK